MSKMTQSTVTVKGVDMASAQSPATHVYIHIHQESALAQLKGLCAGLRNAGPPKASMPYGRLALGVTQILLGAVSCALGVFLYFGPWTELRGMGCAFWVGSVAIAAGAGAVAHEKRQGTLSGWVSGLLTLAGIATAVAALVFCGNDIGWRYDFIDIGLVCDRSAPATTSEYGWTHGWRQHSDYGDSKWLETECREYMEMLTNLFLGIRILLLTICALLAIVSLASLGLGLRSLCCHSFQPLAEDELEKKLLGENSAPPSPCKEKTKATVVV